MDVMTLGFSMPPGKAVRVRTILNHPNADVRTVNDQARPYTF